MVQQNNVRKADSRVPSAAIWLILAAAAFGGLVLAGLFGTSKEPPDWLVQRLSQPDSAQGTLLAVAVIAMLPVVALACYLFVLGSRTVRARHFPPPGLPALRNPPTIEGQPAVRRGRALQAFAAVLIGLAAMVPVLMWQLARLMSLTG